MLPHRESQIKALAENLEPAAKGKSAQNTFIFGEPGIGKTSVVKLVFRKMEEEYPNVKTVYVNCWECNTSIALLSKLTIDLGMMVARRGLGKDEIMQRFLEVFGKTRKSLVVCLDEVDQLVYKDQGALYDLLRMRQHVNKDVGLVMISNNPNVFAKLEPRVSSSLDVDEIHFKPYTVAEMKNILKERVDKAFSSIEAGVPILAANHAVKNGGDVRVGLKVLQKAGRLAEKEGDSKLKVSHLKKVIPDVGLAKPEILKQNISERETEVLKIVEKAGEGSFGEIYEKYAKRSSDPVSERMFQEYVKHLGQLGLIRISEAKVDHKRIISKV
jgi:cell division control protein 6